MKLNFSDAAIQIFTKGFQELKQFHSLMKQKKAIIAYSGGVDSTFLLNFFMYLHSLQIAPKPIIFHLDHKIRKNESQENDLKEYISSHFSTLFFCKKKTFLHCPSV